MMIRSLIRGAILASGLACVAFAQAQEAPRAPEPPTAREEVRPWTAPPTRQTHTPWAASRVPHRPLRNAIYFELGGASLVCSINYERHLNPQLALRVGALFLPVRASEALLGLPVTLSYVGLRWFEIGAGGSLLYSAGRDDSNSWSNLQPVGTGFLGLRVHPTEARGLQFRLGAMVMVADGEAFEGDDDGPPPAVTMFPFGYLSLGGGF